MAINPTISLKDRLGTDLTAPIDGNFNIIEGVQLVLQDIQLGLLTLPGERVGRPTFGSRLRAMIWENLDSALVQLPGIVQGFLTTYEPRIKVLSVDIADTNRNTGLILLRISFIITYTDQTVNLIFPFRNSQELSRA